MEMNKNSIKDNISFEYFILVNKIKKISNKFVIISTNIGFKLYDIELNKIDYHYFNEKNLDLNDINTCISTGNTGFFFFSCNNYFDNKEHDKIFIYSKFNNDIIDTIKVKDKIYDVWLSNNNLFIIFNDYISIYNVSKSENKHYEKIFYLKIEKSNLINCFKFNKDEDILIFCEGDILKCFNCESKTIFKYELKKKFGINKISFYDFYYDKENDDYSLSIFDSNKNVIYILNIIDSIIIFKFKINLKYFYNYENLKLQFIKPNFLLLNYNRYEFILYDFKNKDYNFSILNYIKNTNYFEINFKIDKNVFLTNDKDIMNNLPIILSSEITKEKNYKSGIKFKILHLDGIIYNIYYDYYNKIICETEKTLIEA